jgi:hypothetical protein
LRLPETFAFSQSSLQAYAVCPRRFQLRYVLGVGWPVAHEGSSKEWERRARLGAAFHRVVQQHLLGIEPEKLSASAVQAGVAAWWDAYLSCPPHDMPPVRWVELSLCVPLGGHTLAARYDLVAVEPGERALIVDWKTTESPPGREWLAARMQTLVYRYVLTEAGAVVNRGQRLPPEQVGLVYWFAGRPEQTERFAYDAEAHAAAGRRIRSLVAEIAALDLATWPLTSRRQDCRRCPYQTLCEQEAGLLAQDAIEDELEAEPWELDLEQIAEVEF